MREIKFRAIPVLTKEQLEYADIPLKNGFVYGNYSDGYILGPIVEADDEYCVHEWWCPVKAETIEQFNGLHDKNGKEIYENDIVHFNANGLSGLGIVFWEQSTCQFAIKDIRRGRTDRTYPFWKDQKYVVKSNIHENADLLEVPK